MNIYVGNIPYNVTEDELRHEFEAFGQVKSVNIIKDKFSGDSKGFGFIEMESKDEGRAAIEALNGKEFKGRSINVNEARPRSDNRERRGGRAGQGRGRGGFSGRGGQKNERSGRGNREYR